MGSPDFAVPTLELLLERGHELSLVVTQPDRPAGRGRQVRSSAVAAVARSRGLPLFQPETFKAAETIQTLQSVGADVIVVAAYGLFLPRAVLEMPRLGALNVHPSLLPRHRGAAPVAAAILAGDVETGVTITRMTSKLDAGPILAQRRTPILDSDDTPTLEARLARQGAELLVDTLDDWARGAITPRPQDETQATYAPRITREDGLLDWRESNDVLWRKVRAYRGWPDAFTTWGKHTVKVLQAEPLQGPTEGYRPGQVVAWRAAGGPAWPAVVCGVGWLLLRMIVLEGKRPTSGEAFLRGYPSLIGAVLG